LYCLPVKKSDCKEQIVAFDWQITVDGDALAIGGNHLIHECRRNIDINVIIFNNEIYGLTKGQYSPTSRFGQITKTSPYGTIERPFNVGQLVIGANVSFFARTVDAYIKEHVEIYKAAEYHKGTSVVEVLQNCVIYNDGAHDAITNKKNRKEKQLWLKHGEPMIFGENEDKGIIMENNQLKVVKLGENGITEKDLLVHDAKSDNLGLHLMLATMEYPLAMGVIRDVDRPTYEELMESQIEEIRNKSKIKSVEDLLNSGNTWEIK
jgi:2-oxoglutarate ferredoxin oxidoreductase subunit beta